MYKVYIFVIYVMKEILLDTHSVIHLAAPGPQSEHSIGGISLLQHDISQSDIQVSISI